MKTLIVIPTYNENENITGIINEVFKTVGDDVSILVVDDSSSDGTFDTVEKLKTTYPERLFSIQRASKLGLATAYITGFKWGLDKDFEVFIEMDADYSHNPKYLSEFINEIKENEVVIGSRYVQKGGVEGWGFLRKLISMGGSLYSRLVLNCPTKDLTGGFNAWQKSALNKINLNSIISNGYSFQIEMKYKAFKNGCKIKEIPIIFVDRKFGKSKMSKKIFFEAFVNVFRIRFSK